MRLVAALTAAALIIVSPGLFCYEAAAQIVGVSPQIEAVRPAFQTGNQALPGFSAPLSPWAGPGLTAVSLRGSLPGAPKAFIRPSTKAVAVVPAFALAPGKPVERTPAGPMPLAELISEKETLTLPAALAASLPSSQARGAGFSIMDKILGIVTRRPAASGAELPETPAAAPASLLSPFTPHENARQTPPAPAVVSPLRSMAGRKWDRVRGFFRVLPDKERNHQFWVYTWGQALLNLGIAFHFTALPSLVSPAKEDAVKLGVNRAVNWSAQAAASYSTGPMVDNNSNGNAIFVRTFLGRAVLLLGVSVLFFPGYLGSAAFLAIIFATSYLQAMGLNAGSVAFARLLGDDEAHYDKANAVFNLIQELSGVAGFLIAGSFIGIMDQVLHRVLAGNALCYAVYAGLAALVAFAYKRWLRVPKDELLAAREKLALRLLGKKKPAYLRALKMLGVVFLLFRQASAPGTVVGVSAARRNGKPALFIEVDGDPAAAQGLPAEFEGYPVEVIARRSQFRELAEGFKMIWKDRFLKLNLIFSTLYLIISDAVTFAALPRFVSDIIGGAAAAPWLSHFPVVGAVLAGLTTKAGAFGLFMAAASLGMAISSFFLMRINNLAKPDSEPSELNRRERQGRWSSILEGLAMFGYVLVFLGPTLFGTGLWFSVAALLVAEMLQAPAAIIWAGLTQKVIQAKHPESMGKIFSAIYFYQLICSLVGVLAFGWVMAALPTATGLAVLCAVLAVVGILFIAQPFFTFPLSRGAKPKP